VLEGERTHRINLESDLACAARTRNSIGGYPWLPAGEEWPRCRRCDRRLVLFLQFEIRADFRLPFLTGSQVLVFMCPEHNDIPALCAENRLPEEYWHRGGGHFALYLARPGTGQATQEEEPHLRSFTLRFEPSAEEVEAVGSLRVGSQGLKIGGVPSWAQDAEWHTCCCGSEMGFVGQVPENFPFAKRAEAPEQPDSFSRDDYCLFLGNEVYLFACTAQCHPQAVWAVVQN
jgi:hypothetical protein